MIFKLNWNYFVIHIKRSFGPEIRNPSLVGRSKNSPWWPLNLEWGRTWLGWLVAEGGGRQHTPRQLTLCQKLSHLGFSLVATVARAGRGGRWTNLENSEISKQTGIQTLSKSICGPRWRSPHILVVHLLFVVPLPPPPYSRTLTLSSPWELWRVEWPETVSLSSLHSRPRVNGFQQASTANTFLDTTHHLSTHNTRDWKYFLWVPVSVIHHILLTNLQVVQSSSHSEALLVMGCL